MMTMVDFSMESSACLNLKLKFLVSIALIFLKTYIKSNGKLPDQTKRLKNTSMVWY